MTNHKKTVPHDKGSATQTARFFRVITNWPKSFALFSLLMMAFTASFVPKLVKDTSSDAFLAKDNQALVYRAQVKETFGLKDPIVIAVVSDNAQGIYTPASLRLIDDLSTRVAKLDNIDPDKVTSLASEKNIVGTADGMDVHDFYAPYPDTIEKAQAIKQAISQFPLYQGTLVSRDHRASLIIIELLDQSIAKDSYHLIRNLVDTTNLPDGHSVHIAGEGAISGYLSAYIDNDAKKLNPISVLVITLILFLSFRTFMGMLLPNLIVIGTLMATLGTMAAAGVSFYVITNGLATILIGIAVADSIHILSQYYEEKPDHAGKLSREDNQDIIIRAMGKMLQPITLTSITSVAGFIGLWLGADMPPMKYFGLFAALGVTAAWVYSLFFLPAMLIIFPLKPSKLFKKDQGADLYSRGLTWLGQLALTHARKTMALAALLTILGLIGASQVIIQDAQISNFKEDEPIYIADQVINKTMDGTYFLDVVMETPKPEGLYQPDTLKKIEAFQAYVETFAPIRGSTSVVDYIKQMHKAVNENQNQFHTIPDDETLIAQLFLLYSASGEPTDFEEEVDYDYRHANVRVSFNTTDYVTLKSVIPEIQRYVETHLNGPDLKATLSGRVAVNYEWFKLIGDNHLNSLVISLLFVWLAASLVFRSVVAGLMALIPVFFGLLAVYAVMGFSGIWLGVGTSMFAAIAIGLGIDFAIHTLDRMRDLMQTRTGSFNTVFADLFPSTGRALFFNFAALAFGFLVLTTSDVPPLIRFGTLVAVAVASSFISSMTVLPVIAKLANPRFLQKTKALESSPETSMGPSAEASADLSADLSGQPIPKPVKAGKIIGGLMIAAITTLMLLDGPTPSHAQDQNTALPKASNLVAGVNARADGEFVSRSLKMTLTDRRGKTRTRDTFGYRKYYGSGKEQEKRTVIFYRSPTSLKGTGFLTYDYQDAEKEDDQWLYLPALRKVRRISAADRGDYFLGTDFTYEDIKKAGKLEESDYTFKTIAEEMIGEHLTYVVRAIPTSDATAQELGYSKVILNIDPQIHMIRTAKYFDVNGNALKTLVNKKITQIEGIWTSVETQIVNHKTGHRTDFVFSDISYAKPVADSVFQKRALRRGR